jgi:ubiquitin-protein ligase
MYVYITIFDRSTRMSRGAAKLLGKQYLKLENDPPPGISACPRDDNILEWDAVICGPDDTPFEGGSFKLKMEFPPEYPAKAPRVWFFSKMFHPNVYPDGKICLDILEQPAKWNPDYDAAAVLCGIQAMLGDPNPASPANGEANLMFEESPELYKVRVEEIVALSAMNEGDEEGVNQNLTDCEEKMSHDFQLALSLSLSIPSDD